MWTSNVIKVPFSVAQMSFNMQNESIRISNVTSNESTHSCTKITWTHTHINTHMHIHTHHFTENSTFRNRSFFCNHFRICSNSLSWNIDKIVLPLNKVFKVTTSIEIVQKFYSKTEKQIFFHLSFAILSTTWLLHTRL